MSSHIGHAPSTNGGSRYQNEKVRVAIIGVGNCANAFVQGVHHYRDADPDEAVPGLMHVDLGGYHVRDIEFSAAFDIDAEKVGKDLSEAIWSGQNNTIKFTDDIPHLGIPVQRGMTHDGLGKYLKEKITKAEGSTVDIVEVLKETKTDVVVSYLPVGSEQATKWYVEQILEAGCGFVNCIPVFIAREDYWNNRFKKAGLPIVGDDIKSQVGATIVHRSLARLFGDRGVKLMRTSQLNVGGNMDFYNMLERERLESKKISKTNAVTSIMEHELPADDVYIGPSDYVPWLTDRKWAHIRARGPGLRRRAADRGDEARGLGLAELGRHRHRRRALLQAGHEPRHRRPDRRPELLPHEVALHAAARTTRPARRPRSSSPSTRRRARRPRRPARRPSETRRRRSPPRSPTSDALAPAARIAGRRCFTLAAVPERFSIAQVTPYPWEDAHEVNAFVAELSARAGRARPPRARARPVALARAGARLAAADPRRARAPRGPVRPRRRRARARRRRAAAVQPPRPGARRRPSTSGARSRRCSASRRWTSSTCTSRSRRARRRSRCATRARSTSAPSTRRPSGCSRPRSRAASSSCSSAASTRARPPSTPRAS